MSESGIKSEFEFIAFRVDQTSFKMHPELGLLMTPTIEGNLNWEIKIQLRRPTHFKASNVYVAGLDVLMRLERPSQINSADIADEQLANAKVPLATLTMGIVGSFRPKAGYFDANVEERLVKIQAPLLLFPYLRSAISSFLANSGFGTMILPLINLHELANQQLGNVTIDVK